MVTMHAAIAADFGRPEPGGSGTWPSDWLIAID